MTNELHSVTHTCSRLAKMLMEALGVKPATRAMRSLNEVLSWVIRLSMIALQLPMHVMSIWKKLESISNSMTSFFHDRRVYWYPLSDANKAEQARKRGTLRGLKREENKFGEIRDCFPDTWGGVGWGEGGLSQLAECSGCLKLFFRSDPIVSRSRGMTRTGHSLAVG